MSKTSIYRIDIDITNHIVSTASISIFEIYRHFHFFLFGDLFHISILNNFGNKNSVNRDQIGSLIYYRCLTISRA